MTTNEYIRMAKERREFGGRFWQRDYYDRIIRDDAELNAIRKYIIENPLKWDLDPLKQNRPK